MSTDSLFPPKINMWP